MNLLILVNLQEVRTLCHNNCTTIRYNNIQMCGRSACFCLFKPSPGRYWTKKSSEMASYVMSEQQQSKDTNNLERLKRKKAQHGMCITIAII